MNQSRGRNSFVAPLHDIIKHITQITISYDVLPCGSNRIPSIQRTRPSGTTTDAGPDQARIYKKYKIKFGGFITTYIAKHIILLCDVCRKKFQRGLNTLTPPRPYIRVCSRRVAFSFSSSQQILCYVRVISATRRPHERAERRVYVMSTYVIIRPYRGE